MDLRRSAPSNQRRRRVLLEETAPTEEESADTSGRRRSSSRPPRSYSEAALAINQPRITDLLSGRPWGYVLLLIVFAFSIVGLGFLEARSIAWESEFSEQAAALLHPSQPGSISRWFSSLLRGFAGILATVIFSLRRHKTSDYHARYRCWLLASLGFFLASVDTATGIHHLIRDGSQLLANRWLPNAGWLKNLSSWIGPCLFTFSGLLIARLAIEIRRNRLSLVAMAMSAAGYLLVAALESGWFATDSVAMRAVVIESLRLAADLSLLTSVLTFGRYVYLDSQGLLRRSGKAKKKKEERAADGSGSSVAGNRETDSGTVDSSEETAGSSRSALTSSSSNTAANNRRSDLDSEPRSESGSSRKPPIPVRSSARSSADSEADDDADHESDDSGLSRAERRRQRKLAKREGRSAA
ncbi:MAG: hypothetical protein RIS70_2407 [Planctomycetota bacterium]